MPNKLIFFIGARASGKTTVGRALARQLCWEFADTDELVVRQAGQSIAELVASEGWEAFRTAESAALAGLRDRQRLVVATGGGLVLRSQNRDFLRSHGLVVYLEASASTLIQRLRQSPLPGQRPSLGGLPLEEEVRQVLAERDALYRACAHLVLPATRPVTDLVAELAALPAITPSASSEATYA